MVRLNVLRAWPRHWLRFRLNEDRCDARREQYRPTRVQSTLDHRATDCSVRALEELGRPSPGRSWPFIWRDRCGVRVFICVPKNLFHAIVGVIILINTC